MRSALKPLTPYLERAHPLVFTIYCSAVAFSAYFCIYAFKKPFSAASYEEEWFGGVQLKTALALAQLLGYMSSKFVGIKVVSEVDRKGPARAVILIALACAAEVGCVLHALLPMKFKVIGLFITGLPTGMVWGIAITYLEGRSGTDFMLAILSSSYIIASGAVKDFGLWILTLGVDKFWMPTVAGGAFLIPYSLSVFLLHQIPPPSQADVADRVERKPMYHKERMEYLKEYWPGLLLTNIAVFFLCAYRDFRDTFGAELFKSMGEELQPGVFTKCELAVGVAVTFVVALLVLIKSNYGGFVAITALIVMGFGLAALSVALYDMFDISGLIFMILCGFASFFAMVPLGAPFYERKIAFLKIDNVTSAFPIQLQGALGCVGTILVFLIQNVGVPWDHLEFFRYFSYFLALVSGSAMVLAGLYFAVYKRKRMLLSCRRYSMPGWDGIDTRTMDSIKYPKKVKIHV